MPRPKWLLLGIFDWHTGVPYSIVNETLDFVGERNERRFPTYARLELGVERRFKIFRFQPWIGVRLTNVLGTFLPEDVQNNTGSPFFGAFFNPEPRRIRANVRFELARQRRFVLQNASVTSSCLWMTSRVFE